MLELYNLRPGTLMTAPRSQDGVRTATDPKKGFIEVAGRRYCMLQAKDPGTFHGPAGLPERACADCGPQDRTYLGSRVSL